MQTRPTQYSRGTGPGSESPSDPAGAGTPGRSSAASDSAPGAGPADDAQPARVGHAWAPRNWRIRTRFVAVVSIPLALALIFGVQRIATDISSADSLQLVENLAVLNGGPATNTPGAVSITSVTQDLQRERMLSSGYLYDPTPENLAALQAQQQITAQQTSSLVSLIRETNVGFTGTVTAALNSAVSALLAVPALERQTTDTAVIPTPTEINGIYKQDIAALSEVTTLTAATISDETLRDPALLVSQLSQTTESVSQAQADFYGLLSRGTATPADMNTLSSATSTADASLAQFPSLTPAGVSSSFEQQVEPAAASFQILQQSISSVSAGNANVDFVIPAQQYLQQANALTAGLGTLQTQLNSAFTAQATSEHETTVRNAIDFSVLIIMALILALIATSLVGRAMVRRVRGLRTSALEAAETNLPMAIADIEEAGGSLDEVRLPSLAIPTLDELGELSRAFDQVQGEALRLAAEQSRLRATVNAMFVNLARRSQSLVERQLRLIDELEQGEQDPDQLHSLFRLDHLATRMRRNGENLLVLAGQESERRWSRSVPLVDLLRAATSEVEQYERIQLQAVTNVELAGRAINDIVHLVAELLENATLYSAPETEVIVRSQPVTGGILLEVSDQGIGMTQGELQSANERLAQPPAVDVSVSRRMGLFVVSRLAHRHGIRVQLRRSVAGGITAFVMFPDTIVEHPNSMTGDYPADAAERGQEVGRMNATAEAPSRYAGAFDEAGTVGAGRDAFAPAFAATSEAQRPGAAAADPYATAPGAESFDPDLRGRGAAQAFAGAAAAHGRRRPTFLSSPDGSGSAFVPPERRSPASPSGPRTGEYAAVTPEPEDFATLTNTPRQAAADTAHVSETDTASGAGIGAGMGGGRPGAVPLPRRSVSSRAPRRSSTPVPDGWEPQNTETAAQGPSNTPRMDDAAGVGGPATGATGSGTPASGTPASGMGVSGVEGMPTRRPGQSLPISSRPSRMNRPGDPLSGASTTSGGPSTAGDPPLTPPLPSRRPAGPPSVSDPGATGPRAISSGARPATPPHILDASTPMSSDDTEVRLPIFEAVESEWFRRRTGRPGRSPNPDDALGTSTVTGPLPGVRRSGAGSGANAGANTAGINTAGINTAGTNTGAASPAAESRAGQTRGSWTSDTAARPQVTRAPAVSQRNQPSGTTDSPALPTRPAGAAGRPASSGFGAGWRDNGSEANTGSWRSPGDEGWRAAEAVRTPSANGLTSAGLPIRVPKAHLVPGAAKSADPAPDETKRSPDAIRSRLSSFQRGIHQGRMAGRQGGTTPQDAPDLRPTENN